MPNETQLAGYSDHFVVDATDVYTIGGDVATIRRYSKCGGPPVTMLDDSQYAYPNALVGDAEWLYWSDNAPSRGGRIVRMKKSGGAPETIVSGLYNAFGLAVDDMRVYYTATNYSTGGAPAEGSVLSVPKSGGSATPLATAEASPSHLVVDGADVFYAAGSSIKHVSTTGGATETLADGLGVVTSLAVSADRVAWIELGAQDSTDPRRLALVPRVGGPIVEAVRSKGLGAAVASDGTRFFYALSSASNVDLMAFAPGQPAATLGSLHLPAGVGTDVGVGLAVDAQAVWWLDHEWVTNPGGAADTFLRWAPR